MICQFFSAIPSQGFVEFPWQPPGLFDQPRDNAFGVLIGDFNQHDVARLAFDQGGDVAVFGAADQITFPRSVNALQSPVGNDDLGWRDPPQWQAVRGSRQRL